MASLLLFAFPLSIPQIVLILEYPGFFNNTYDSLYISHCMFIPYSPNLFSTS